MYLTKTFWPTEARPFAFLTASTKPPCPLQLHSLCQGDRRSSFSCFELSHLPGWFSFVGETVPRRGRFSPGRLRSLFRFYMGKLQEAGRCAVTSAQRHPFLHRGDCASFLRSTHESGCYWSISAPRVKDLKRNLRVPVPRSGLFVNRPWNVFGRERMRTWCFILPSPSPQRIGSAEVCLFGINFELQNSFGTLQLLEKNCPVQLFWCRSAKLRVACWKCVWFYVLWTLFEGVCGVSAGGVVVIFTGVNLILSHHPAYSHQKVTLFLLYWSTATALRVNCVPI